MSGEPTLRQIHERCKARHARDFPWTECKWCKLTHPCADYSDAVAALALLEHCSTSWASRDGLQAYGETSQRLRLVPDPEPPPAETPPGGQGPA